MPLNTAVAARARQDEQPFKPLFSPYQLGDIELANRLVMAPMTRSRAVRGNVPNPLAATYNGGFVDTAATPVCRGFSPRGSPEIS
jgi:hypothetical protein